MGTQWLLLVRDGWLLVVRIQYGTPRTRKARTKKQYLVPATTLFLDLPTNARDDRCVQQQLEYQKSNTLCLLYNTKKDGRYIFVIGCYALPVSGCDATIVVQYCRLEHARLFKTREILFFFVSGKTLGQPERERERERESEYNEKNPITPGMKLYYLHPTLLSFIQELIAKTIQAARQVPRKCRTRSSKIAQYWRD